MDQFLEKYASVPRSQRLSLVALLVAGIAAIFYYTIHEGQVASVEKLRAQYAQKTGTKDQKDQVVKNLSEYEGKLAATQRELEIARSKLPDSADVPQLLAQLGSKARQVGLNIEEFQPGTEVAKGFYAEIPFNMRVTGSYHEIAMFIDSVGKLDRIINVTDLTMGNPVEQNAKVTVKSTFKVKTYRFTQTNADDNKKKKKKKKKKK